MNDVISLSRPTLTPKSWLGVAAIVVSLAFASAAPAQEVIYPNEAFARLDTFEQHVLTGADKTFNANAFRQAEAEYAGFILEFPKSAALPYAILRRARSLHLDGKRFEAIKQYQEVLDYFPNATPFAAPASYYIGLCHVENGDTGKAMDAWTKMAADAEYSKHPLAAAAINQLAGELIKKGDPGRAATYYQQVAIDFRKNNPPAANEAIGQVILYDVRTRPNEARLREFYEKVQTFAAAPGAVPKNIAADKDYWQQVTANVRRFGGFTAEEADKGKRYYQYWASAMAGKFPDWDDFQIDMADFQRSADQDEKKWTERLDKQFQTYQKEGDYTRVIRWIGLFAAQKNKANEYYAKLNFEKMSNDQIMALTFMAFETLHDPDLGRNTFTKIRLGKMTDPEKNALQGRLWNADAKLVADVCMSMEDKDYGRMSLLRYYQYPRYTQLKPALELADQTAKVPAYAEESLMIKGSLLLNAQRFQEAIAAYQAADKPDQTVFAIVACYLGLGKNEMAVAQLREAENFLPAQAPAAALQIAHIYRDAKQQDQYIAALRSVTAKYPKSPESSTAHLELEALGKTNIGGGVEAQ